MNLFYAFEIQFKIQDLRLYYSTAQLLFFLLTFWIVLYLKMLVGSYLLFWYVVSECSCELHMVLNLKNPTYTWSMAPNLWVQWVHLHQRFFCPAPKLYTLVNYYVKITQEFPVPTSFAHTLFGPDRRHCTWYLCFGVSHCKKVSRTNSISCDKQNVEIHVLYLTQSLL